MSGIMRFDAAKLRYISPYGPARKSVDPLLAQIRPRINVLEMTNNLTSPWTPLTMGLEPLPTMLS